MPQHLTRRNFLLLAGPFIAGLTGFACTETKADKPENTLVAPTLPPSPPPAPPLPTVQSGAPPYRTFTSGSVTAIGQNSLTVDDDTGGTTAIVYDAKIQFWDDLWVKDVPIRLGDHVSASGAGSGPGEFRAEKLYVNIENLIGRILEVNGGPKAPYTFVMTDRYDQMRTPPVTGHRVYMDPRTRVPKPNPTTEGGTWVQELLGDPWPVKVGDLIQVTGRLNDGTVLAALIFPT